MPRCIEHVGGNTMTTVIFLNKWSNLYHLMLASVNEDVVTAVAVLRHLVHCPNPGTR